MSTSRNLSRIGTAVTANATLDVTFANSITVGTTITANSITVGTTIIANGSTGTANQILTSSGSGANAYWATPAPGLTTGKSIAMAIVFGG